MTVTPALLRPSERRGTSTGDADELDRFSEALRPRIMGPRLAGALEAASTACRVLDAKYQPGIGATVLYEVDGRLVRGDLLGPQPSARRPGTAAVVAPGLALFPFPADPDLRRLPEVMAADRFGPELGAALGWPGRTRGSDRADRCRVHLLRYRPGKRATVLAEFSAPRARFVAKVYHDARKASAVVEESTVLQQVAGSARELRFPHTVGWLPELSTVVQDAVAGVPLAGLVDSPRGPGTAATTEVRRAARALAELHEARPPTVRERPVERELGRFHERSQRIGAVDPVVGRALDGLAERLAACHRHLPRAELGTVHGDCKPSQFVLGDTQVYLLDVDHLGVSDLAADVGTFTASLRQSAVRRRLASGDGGGDGYGDLADAFVASYLEARSGAGDRVRCRWQEAVALDRKALRAYARAPRSPVALALTAAAHRCLDTLEDDA